MAKIYRDEARKNYVVKQNNKRLTLRAYDDYSYVLEVTVLGGGDGVFSKRSVNERFGIEVVGMRLSKTTLNTLVSIINDINFNEND